MVHSKKKQSLKYDTNEPVCKTETDTWAQRTDLCLPSGRGFGRMRLADANYYLDLIKNKVILYSIGNCIQ